MSTNKNTEKYQTWNASLGKRLELKYNVSKSMVYYSITGERDSSTAKKIRREYKNNQKRINSILDSVFKINKQA